MTAQNAGAFRIQKRTADLYEVWFKSFRSGVMIMIADGVTKTEAETLKDNLNTLMYDFIRNVANDRLTRVYSPQQKGDDNGEDK